MRRRRIITGAGTGFLAAWALPRRPRAAVDHFAGGVFDVTRWGAVGDGRTDVTSALQRAIDACAAAGGGLVLVPPGRYLTAALQLHSRLQLQLQPGAVLLASKRFDDFPPIKGRHEGIERTIHASLLTGVDLEDVSITGAGVLDGQGEAWWQAAEETRKIRVDARLPREAENPPGTPLKWARPRLINLIRCRNVHIEGLTLKDSPSINIHPLYCQNVVVDGVTIVGHDAIGSDGIVIDSCKEVRIRDCELRSGADCISMKSGYNEDGRRVAIPCEDVIVSNCNLVYSYGSGIAVGSETAGGIRNVTIDNCVIDRCRIGISIRSPRGRGGIVERIRASNLVFDRIDEMAIKVTNFFDSVRMEGRFGTKLPEGRRNPETARSRLVPINAGTPTFSDLQFSGLTLGQVREVAVIEGLPERFIHALRIADVTALLAKAGVSCTNTRQTCIDNLVMARIDSPAVDARDVQGIEIHRLKCQGPSAQVPLVWFENVAGAFVHGCDVGDASKGYEWLHQEGSRAITLAGNRVPG